VSTNLLAENGIMIDDRRFRPNTEEIEDILQISGWLEWEKSVFLAHSKIEIFRVIVII
jgi:hypothetical protein